MSVVTSFEDKKREKQMKNEYRLLRELSIESLKKSVLIHFSAARIGSSLLKEGIEDACFDIAIEAYLTGGEMSRFIARGETAEMAKNRCRGELQHYVETLFNFWLYCDYGRGTLTDESIFLSCEHFVDYWWKEGFKRGERRYKLRLH